MGDRVYTEGFPERWSMVHRDDCTLLVRRGDMGMFVLPSQAICMAPKLMQGEAWLETAQEIAHAMAGSREQELNRMFDEFCDGCGIGPPHDEQDRPAENIRSLRTWKCDRCDHINERPKARENPSPTTILLGPSSPQDTALYHPVQLSDKEREWVDYKSTPWLNLFRGEKVAEAPTFSSDEDALDLLESYGYKEAQNGVIREDWRCFDAKCRAAVNYLCAEWDFVFEDTAGKRHYHWRVSVETSGEHIVSIEPEMLTGREISEADEDAIRTAAHHLLAFIGDPVPQSREEVP